MKLVKMSLVAGMLLGANLYAIDNVKVNGSASLFYATDDINTKGQTNADLFDKDSAYADVGLSLGVTADLTQGVSTGATLQAVSTLGLENNLVSATWSGAHDSDAGGVNDASYFSEAWIAGTAGKTTLKAGRQSLKTPLAFTETWSITTNTFEAAVLINEDIPDTTLIGAWIGKSNGSGDNIDGSTANVTSTDGKFNTFAKDGAYAVGAINNSYTSLTAQGWYYDLQGLASAYWLQGDLDMDGILAGAQYVNIDSSAAGAKDDSAYGLMLGYAMKDVVTVKVAYSSVDDEGTLGVANVATRAQDAGAASSLYTEMWWWYGTVSQTGADTVAVTAETTLADVDFFLGYYTCDIEQKGIAVGDNDGVDELVLTASKSFGPLDTSFAVIYDSFDYKGGTSSGDTEDITSLQVYLTYNF